MSIVPLPPEIQSKLDALTPRMAIALTAIGEADCYGYMGMQATVNTGLNRLNSGVKWWGKTLKDIFLHSGGNGIHQYSCWNSDNHRLANLIQINSGALLADALPMADMALDGSLSDITNGATHYYSKKLVSAPNWARNRQPVFTLYDQLYYRIVD